MAYSDISQYDQALIRAAKAYEAIPDWHHRALLAFAASMFWGQILQENDAADQVGEPG